MHVCANCKTGNFKKGWTVSMAVNDKREIGWLHDATKSALDAWE